MKTICLLLFAAVALVLSNPVSSEEMPDSTTFTQLDRNHDGYISIIEATGQNELLQQWTEVDKDTDGKLEKAEFSAFEIQQSTGYVPDVDPDEAEIGAAPTD